MTEHEQRQIKAAEELFGKLQAALKPYETHLDFRVEDLNLSTAIGYSALVSMTSIKFLADGWVAASQEEQDRGFDNG